MKPLSLLTAALFLATAVSASVVQPVGVSSQVLIPAAGSTPGANGTFFHSDITVINLGSTDEQVVFQWLPQAGTGAPSSATITIPARNGLRAPTGDFVADVLHQSGLGSLVITATSNGSAIDPNGRLSVSSRIWTNLPNGQGGTTSQSFPAIPMSTINTPGAAFFGVSDAANPSKFRVNVGVVNLDPNFTQTFAVTIPVSSGTPVTQVVTLPPLTMTQVALGSNISPIAQIQVLNATTTASRSNLWTAYASTVDNTTGDAWTELPVAITP